MAPDETAGVIARLRDHVHPLPDVREALLPHFTLGEAVPGAYLHRWKLEPGILRYAEEHLIAGARLHAPISSQLTGPWVGASAVTSAKKRHMASAASGPRWSA